jgi:hypothetical protein
LGRASRGRYAGPARFADKQERCAVKAMHKCDLLLGIGHQSPRPNESIVYHEISGSQEDPLHHRRANALTSRPHRRLRPSAWSSHDHKPDIFYFSARR